MARLGWVSALALAFAFIAAPVFAQGGSSSATLSGVVVDKDGGSVPGATVVVTKEATGEKLPPQVTNASGAYSFPGLAAGKYKVTISLQGFKTQEIETTLVGGSSNSINTKLEVGQVTEVVNVTSGTDLVRTDTPTVTQTVSSNFIQTLPRSDRAALSFLIFMPGVTVVGGNQNSRSATVAGLPNVQYNITIDGITNSNLLQSGDGFFTLVGTRLDAVEEVSLTSSTAGADASGQGAVQIRFVTRSGTNKFEVSLYEYYKNAAFNSNAFFTRVAGLPVPFATSHTYGGRVGGPIILPGFDGRGRAFFFFNQEEVYAPAQVQRTRTMLSDAAYNGLYTYGATTTKAGTQVNLLSIAAASGQIATVDPQMKSILDTIRTAAASTGTLTQQVNDPNRTQYDYFVDTKSLRHTPTTNITVNLSPKNRLQGSYYWQYFSDGPDTLNSAEPTFPTLPAFGLQTSYRTTGSISLRTTLNTAMVNEARGGWQWSPVGFFSNTTASMFDNQFGNNLTLVSGVNSTTAPDFNSLTNAASVNANSPEVRNTYNYTASDSFNWLKGAHALNFGGDYTRVVGWLTDSTNVPTISMGFETAFDPANAMFTTANFPGATDQQMNGARALYALLTGRVKSIPGQGSLNESGDKYIYNGPVTDREYQDDFSLYAQDTWRWKPTVTLTMGLRYQLTLPMTPQNSAFSVMSVSDACGVSGVTSGSANADGSTTRFCNMFQPGVYLNATAPAPTYTNYSKGTKGYNLDLNNLGPLGGVAWRPNVQDGWLRKILGDPELATINGGFTRSYVRNKLDNFRNVYLAGPGATVSASRSTSNTAFPLVNPGESWPILYSQKDRLGAPPFNDVPAYPFQASAAIANFNGMTGVCTTCSFSGNLFNPDIQVPWTDSWNVSLQRSITKDTVFEIRYQGNRSYDAWTRESWSSTSASTGLNLQAGSDGAMIGASAANPTGDWYNPETGQGEFNLAQQNLRANVLAGKGPTFAYTGIPGTFPLPITLAHLDGSAASTDPNAYKGAIWTSTTFTGALNPYSPNPGSFAGNLYATGFSSTQVPAGVNTRVFLNAVGLGYPLNYWAMNPALSDVRVTTNSAEKPYNNLVTLQVRRRLSQGLAASLSYTWQKNVGGNRLDYHEPLLYLDQTSVPHAIQAIWSYDIPVGRGKKYGANMNAWLDGIVGGWTFSGTSRFQTQAFFLRNTVLVGMTNAEAQQALKQVRFIYNANGQVTQVYNFPLDIYTNTRLAYATDATKPDYYGTDANGVSLAPNGPNAMVGPDGSTYRYFAPASSPACNFVFTGDCNTQTVHFLGRWFGEMDFRLAKAFQLPGHARFEFSAEVFNATKALNFPNQINPGSAASTFQITSTQSNARTAQLVWRVTW